jgi:hypothetical protein
MKSCVFLTAVLSVLMSSPAWAQGPKQANHNHGAAEARIAIEGKRGRIEFESPTSAIYGFEYEAKTTADKSRKEKAIQLLQDKISDIFSLPSEKKCQYKTEVYEVQQEKNHASLFAEFSVNCAEDLKGSEMVVSIQKTFPKIKKIKIDLLVNDVQKSQTIEKDGESIGFK